MKAMRIVTGVVCVFLAGAVLGLFWLWQSPYWAGITLFWEDHRVENFRTMDRVFPSKDVRADGRPWPLHTDLQGLPDAYEFGGRVRPMADFFDATSTTGLLVLYRGVIVHEQYRLGADATSRFTSWSMAKSVLSALIGIAVEEGHIQSIHDPLDHYVPELAQSGYAGVTIEQALTMSSGVGFDEDYDNPVSDVNRLFFGLAAGQPMIQTLAGLERIRAPGTYNDYISADSMALGMVLQEATGMPNEDYLAARLWGPMGAENDAFWNTGRAGPVLPFCCLNATLRDYARFGRLFIEDGARDGVQIIPRDWVRASTQPTAAHLQPGDNPASFWTFGYGYHWWVPENPQEEFLAIGIWGQYIFVDRSKEVVIVKTSADADFDTRDHETVAVFRAIAADFASAP